MGAYTLDTRRLEMLPLRCGAVEDAGTNSRDQPHVLHRADCRDRHPASSSDRLDSAGERRWVDDDRAGFSPRRNGCWDPRGMDEEAGCAWLDGVSFSHCFLNYK